MMTLEMRYAPRKRVTNTPRSCHALAGRDINRFDLKLTNGDALDAHGDGIILSPLQMRSGGVICRFLACCLRMTIPKGTRAISTERLLLTNRQVIVYCSYFPPLFSGICVVNVHDPSVVATETPIWHLHWLMRPKSHKIQVYFH